MFKTKRIKYSRKFKRFSKKSNFKKILMKSKYNCYCYKVTGLRYGERNI